MCIDFRKAKNSPNYFVLKNSKHVGALVIPYEGDGKYQLHKEIPNLNSVDKRLIKEKIDELNLTND